LDAQGVHFGVSTSRSNDGVSVHQPTQQDFSVSFKEFDTTTKNWKALSWVSFLDFSNLAIHLNACE
jgi:endo-1,3(4)-beta-glucanase